MRSYLQTIEQLDDLMSRTFLRGFTSVACQSNGKHERDEKAFIFSLVYQDSKTIKMKLIDPQKAIFCLFNCGPNLGDDIIIPDTVNRQQKCRNGITLIHNKDVALLKLDVS